MLLDTPYHCANMGYSKSNRVCNQYLPYWLIRIKLQKDQRPWLEGVGMWNAREQYRALKSAIVLFPAQHHAGGLVDLRFNYIFSIIVMHKIALYALLLSDVLIN